MKLDLLDASGVSIGRVQEVVLVPTGKFEQPFVRGLVVSSQRREIFVKVSDIASVDESGVRLKSWDISLAPFRARRGDILVKSGLFKRRVAEEFVSDVAISELRGHSHKWTIEFVQLSKRTRRSPRLSSRLVSWDQVSAIFTPSSEVDAEAARLRDLHPSDAANVVRALPLDQGRQLAAAMDDDRLADILEELPEDEQLHLIEGFDFNRLKNVFEEMEFDDLADLLIQMPISQRNRVLEAMDDKHAAVIRQLLTYAEGTAGSLMTPNIIVMSPDSTVADALAHIREPNILVSVATQVFVADSPNSLPTGSYRGVVNFQRLLRELPQIALGKCAELGPTILPSMSEREVAECLASYNLLAVAVCDQKNRLLGAITVDDVLDRTLPSNWRRNTSSPLLP